MVSIVKMKGFIIFALCLQAAGSLASELNPGVPDSSTARMEEEELISSHRSSESATVSSSLTNGTKEITEKSFWERFTDMYNQLEEIKSFTVDISKISASALAENQTEKYSPPSSIEKESTTTENMRKETEESPDMIATSAESFEHNQSQGGQPEEKDLVRTNEKSLKEDQYNEDEADQEIAKNTEYEESRNTTEKIMNFSSSQQTTDTTEINSSNKGDEESITSTDDIIKTAGEITNIVEQQSRSTTEGYISNDTISEISNLEDPQINVTTVEYALTEMNGDAPVENYTSTSEYTKSEISNLEEDTQVNITTEEYALTGINNDAPVVNYTSTSEYTPVTNDDDQDSLTKGNSDVGTRDQKMLGGTGTNPISPLEEEEASSRISLVVLVIFAVLIILVFSILLYFCKIRRGGGRGRSQCSSSEQGHGRIVPIV